MSKKLRATMLLCIVPTIVHLFTTIAALLYGAALLETSLLGVPIVWPISIALFLIVVGIFAAGFRDLVAAWVIWPALVANGMLTIVFFAGLYAASGVICFAEICSPDKRVLANSPQIVTSLGRPVENTDEGECRLTPSVIGAVAAEKCINLDHSLASGLYFSAVTFSTVGYGDFQPLPRMRLIAALEAVFGFLFFGLLAGAAIDSFSKTKREAPTERGEKSQASQEAKEMRRALIALRSRLKVDHDNRS